MYFILVFFFDLFLYNFNFFNKPDIKSGGDDNEVRFVLDQHAELDFYCASSLKQQSAGRHVARRNNNQLQQINHT
jgi:hypothetical protein